MDDINQQIQAFLEKRDAERVSARLKIKFTPVEKSEATRILNQGDLSDVFAAAHVNQPETGTPAEQAHKDAFTENISISGMKLSGDLRLVGGKALNEGTYLLVEIQVPDAPMPVHALATVIWSDADHSTTPVSFHAGLFFVAINKQDVMKVARFLVLQRKARQ
jgi:hypothetical protein